MRWNVVILGRDRQIGAANRPAVLPKTIKGLRGRDFVHEVQVDVEEIWLAVFGVDDMVVPHLLAEGSGFGAHGLQAIWLAFACGTPTACQVPGTNSPKGTWYLLAKRCQVRS